MDTHLFDKSLEYDALLQRGLRFTGDDKLHFMRERVSDLRRALGSRFRPRRILDFGCGVGDCVAHLSEVFPDADVVGVDTAGDALRHATQRHASSRTSFCRLSEFVPRQDFDLCHCSGVFHHIAPSERPQALAVVRSALKADGLFALIENNPWNPGTRLVMSHIPFDAGAVPLSVLDARRMLRDNHFEEISRPRFLFWFPRWLAVLRPLERRLTPVPLGGQYCLLAAKKGAAR